MKNLVNFVAPVLLSVLVATPGSAATLQSSGFTTDGTFEAVYSGIIDAGSTGEATINAPGGQGLMGWSLAGTGGTILSDTLRTGFLLETESITRGYFHSGPTDGALELTVAWLDSAWTGLTGTEISAILEPGGVGTGLGAFACLFDCPVVENGGNGSGGGLSTVPLPAAGWLLFTGIGGVSLLRRNTGVRV